MTRSFVPLRWAPVAGGVCLFGDKARPRPVGDLLVSITPVTYFQSGLLGPGDMPVTGVDYFMACDLAAALGGRLPTSLEWEWIAGGPQRRLFPWGSTPWQPHLAWLGSTPGHEGPCPVGAHPDGATTDGVLDLAGNVWEWTASSVLGGGHVIRGGSFASRPLYAQTTFLNAVHDERRSAGIGVRLVKTP